MIRQKSGGRWVTAGAVLFLVTACAPAPTNPSGPHMTSASEQPTGSPTCGALGKLPKEPDPEVREDPVTFEVSGNVATMVGTIGADFEHRICRLSKQQPQVTTIEMVDVPGSSTEGFETLEGGRIARQLGYETVMPGDGQAESGGVDFFVSGTTRLVADGGCLGVHSTEIDTEDGPVAAADLPRDDPEHAPFLAYYADMGIPPDFYWFTLSAAPPDGIHYLTPRELTKFQIVTADPPTQPCPIADEG